MSAIKRLSIIILFFLLVLSIMDDLGKNTSPPVPGTFQRDGEISIAHIKVSAGDTVLSIMEEINDLDTLDIEQIIRDFERLNPGADIHFLVPDDFYYFPLYNEP